MSAHRHTTPAPRAPQHRRAVRLFVGLHLAAVAVLYAIAVMVGGGWASPPMPAVAAAGTAAKPQSAPPSARPTAPAFTAAAAPTAPPAWTQRAEVSPPWEAP